MEALYDTGRGIRVRRQPAYGVKIAFGSVTYAEKGRAVLASHGIPSRIIRLDPALTQNGCTYGLTLTGNAPGKGTLSELLTQGHVRFSEIIADTV